MAKESLFNILDNRVVWEEAHCLDLFAGTGSIGFEMLSRGAKSVLAIELEYAHAKFIKEVASVLNDDAYHILRKDVLHYLREQASRETPSQQFDLIFADPPYQMEELTELPRLILESGILAPDGLLVLEHPKRLNFSQHPNFQELRHYGAVHFSFFRANETSHDNIYYINT